MLPASSLMLIFPLLGSGARTDVAASVALEESAGLVPLEFDQPSEAATITTVTLSAGLRHLTRTSELVLRYAPRWYLQIPNTVDTYRPLLMQRASGTHRLLATPRTTLLSQLDGGIGEMAYSNIPPELASNSGTIRSNFVRIAYGNAGTQVGYRLTRLHTLGVGLNGGVRAPLDDGAGFTPSYNTALSVSDIYSLTPADSLNFQVRGGYIGIIGDSPLIPTAQDLVAFGSNVIWMHRLSQQSELTSSLGAAFTYARESEELSFLPLGSITHTQNFGTRGWQWSNSTAAGVQGTFNDFSATYLAQGFVRWGLSGTYGRDWTFAATVSGTTNLSSEPLVPADYETLIAVTQPTSYRLTDNTRLNFGLRAGLRAGHISDLSSLSPQIECTGFVGLTYTLGTDNTQGQWLR